MFAARTNVKGVSTLLNGTLALTLPLDAVIVTLAMRAAVTTPLALTETNDASELDHVTAAPGMVLPLASFTMAVSCAVVPASADAAPEITMEDGEAVRVTTVIVAAPDTPSVVAEMVAVPAATPVRMPAGLIVATLAFDVVHENVLPAIAVFDASRAVAVSETVFPDSTVMFAPGLITTDATTGAGVVTVTVRVPV